MRISNFGIEVLYVKVKYWRIFCDVISLFAQVFIVSFDRAYKEVSTKKILKFFLAQFLWYDCTFKKQFTVSVPLTFKGQILYNHISILHKFQIDISSISRVIKYQNIGRTHRQTYTQTHTHTGWKKYLATPSGGEVITALIATHTHIYIYIYITLYYINLLYLINLIFL